MHSFFNWAVVLAAGGTFAVLVVGVVAMLRQGGFNAKHSNKLMRFRVLFQFAAITLIALAFLIGNR